MSEVYSQRQASFSNGDVIDAPLFNAEFDQLVEVFKAATGHKHDGTEGGGSTIPFISDTFEADATGIFVDVTDPEEHKLVLKIKGVTVRTYSETSGDSNAFTDQVTHKGEVLETYLEQLQATSDEAILKADTFRGRWEDLSGALPTPSEVHHKGYYWKLMNSLTDVTASEPSVSQDWELKYNFDYRLGDLKNPVVDVLKTNRPVAVLDGALLSTRATEVTYTSAQGVETLAKKDELMEEEAGYLIDGDTTIEFPALKNVPRLTNPFSIVIDVDNLQRVATGLEYVLTIPAAETTVATEGLVLIKTTVGFLFRYSDGTNNDVSVAYADIPKDKDTLALVYDGTDFKAYFGGIQKGPVVQRTANLTVDTTRNVYVGRREADTNTNFAGHIANLTIYDFALTQDEVALLSRGNI